MQYVGQLVLSRNWGSSQLAKLRDSGSTLRRRRRFLYLGTNLILPGRGAPSGSATPFSRIGAFPEKIFILHLRVIWQGSKFPVTKTEQTITGPARLVRPAVSVWIHSEGTAQQPRAFFYSKIRKSRWKLVFIAPSEPMIECPWEVSGCAT